VTTVVWDEHPLEVLLELSAKEQEVIQDYVRCLEFYPDMYPVRRTGKFRGYRVIPAGEWLIYYRHKGNKVYIRALYPARAKPL
jgi:hypothetical protein